uniref:Mitochondrial import inner membrane translocase subunit TIM9 n=1 Tax=Tanacetum cinerariifolium TaxID=118510 RepID=A0A6L2NVL4_TANCI|nr:mitochondrial import inner membrane translocase subunit TIM9 [Tanacetum cinerariifolium]
MFPVLSRMAMDLISVRASSVASESTFSTSGRVFSIRRTRLTPASFEMCMCLKDHLDTKERKQDKCPLETPLDFKEDVFDDEVQRNEAIPLSDEETALDANASSEGTLSPEGPRLPAEDQARMATMIDQLQVRDSLRMYNNLVERCFTDCVDSFRRKTLDKQEETCVKRCAEKFLKHSMRVGLSFKEGVVDWKSTKQSTTAMSAIKAEYIAALEVVMEAVWIKKFISRLGALDGTSIRVTPLSDQKPRDAISRDDGLKIPQGCYYLVDTGYCNAPGFLAPFRGTQVRIILACCLLHNLIRKYMSVDPLEFEQDEEDQDQIEGEEP